MSNIRRIFISSTAEDLKPHRAAAALAIEKLGHKADWFEHTWPAQHRPTLEASRLGAERADAVVVLLSHRYGWVPTTTEGGDGIKSVTWHEHDAAIKADRPIFAFLVDEQAPWTGKKEQDRLVDHPDQLAEIGAAVKNLRQFRAALGKKPAGFFSTPDSLAAEVSAAIATHFGPADGASGGGFSALASATTDERKAVLDCLRDQRREWRQLPLAGIDQEQTNAASHSRQPELDKVYVSLNVVESPPEPEDDAEDAGPSRRKKARSASAARRAGFDGREREPWTALDACVHHPRAVILGDPGSGKSTFLRMLAIALASRVIGDGEASGVDDSSPRFDRPLLPVLVTVRDFANDLGAVAPEHRLCAFVERALGKRGLGAAYTVIHRMLRDGDAILLLDGLDEIAQSERRTDVIAAIRAFAVANPKTRVLVTCRVAAYTVHELAGASRGRRGAGSTDWRLPTAEFPVITLASFNEPQQAQFIGGWYRELSAARRISRDPEERSESLRRALKRSHLRRMASNPLLLTVMALVHASAGELPDQRVLLYREAVETLLRRWQQGRDPGRDAGDSRDPRDRECVPALLEEAGTTAQLLEKQLWSLARTVHAGMAEADGESVADISHEQLVEKLGELHGDPDQARAWACRLIGALKHRTGLLIERRWGVFTVPHRTFQEYLAARDMGTAADPIEEAMRHRGAANDLWREVILMVGGTFAHLENNASKGLSLVERLLDAGCGEPTPRAIDDLILAADFLCEMTPAAVRGAYGGPALLDRATTALGQAMFDERIAITGRARIGSALGRLGDRRAGVAEIVTAGSGARIPVIAWSRELAAGPFLMGNDDPEAKRAWESPRFTATIVQPFKISIHPITVAQFRLFLDAGGYRPGASDRFWTAQGLEWRNGSGVNGPELFADVFQTPNHPQVGVSSHEATAFCRWISEASGLPIRLPTEMEWERAARHTDARLYPWGQAEPLTSGQERANLARSIGNTTPVGLYPRGAALCGAEDLSGNVWEWCHNAWVDDYANYPRQPQIDRDDDPRSRVVRGGAWSLVHDYGRCASRDWYDPDDRDDCLGFRVCVCPCSHSDR